MIKEEGGFLICLGPNTGDTSVTLIEAVVPSRKHLVKHLE